MGVVVKAACDGPVKGVDFDVVVVLPFFPVVVVVVVTVSMQCPPLKVMMPTGLLGAP